MTFSMSPKIKNFINDCLFPSYCQDCGCFLKSDTKKYLCEKCFKKLFINSEFYCPICFKRNGFETFKKCPHSDKSSNLDFIGFATDYENETIKNLIHKFKYNFAKQIRWSVSDIIFAYLDKAFKEDWDNFYIIPIPLHKSRYNWRGFNQSEIIAELIAKHYNTHLLNNILIRNRKTEAQAKLPNRESRQRNIKDAFCLNEKIDFNLQEKSIILFDDVYASGATLNEAAKILKSNGAKRIIGLVIAK